jgi:hypothetical protein
MSDPKDLFGDDPAQQQMQDEIERHGEAVYALVADYAVEHQLGDGFVADLTFEAGLRLRVMTYLADTAKPSGSGLKLDLDRCLRDLEDMFRDYKKMADEFIQSAQEAVAAEAKAPESK